MPHSFDAVMFDLDGTLADTLALIADCGNHALRSLGRPDIAQPRYRYLAGQGLRSLMSEALGPADSPLIEQGMDLFREHYEAHALAQTRAYDGVPQLLDALVDRGLKLAVLSNKPDRFTRETVAHLFPRTPFQAVVGERPGVALKPDPAGALRIAAELGVAPHRWLYVGDTMVDMRTAVGAGMFPLGVLWGFRDEPELLEHGAKAIIPTPAELLDLL